MSDSPAASWVRSGGRRRLVRHSDDDDSDNDNDDGVVSVGSTTEPATLNGHPDTTLDSKVSGGTPRHAMGHKAKLEDPEMLGICPDVCTDPMGLREDRPSVALLMLLYVLQGIPLGLAGSIPYLLQSRKINYKEQAMFSLVYWPFSVKLLWAPFVDAVYVQSFGRRKSWLVPVQYMIGGFMFLLSFVVTDLIEGPSTNIYMLTMAFFVLNFLAATQDIAVDGWALTMLSRRNVGWASTCNSVGQTAGYFMGHVVFLALESADLCNTYIRSEPKPVGILTLSDFLYFWSIVFLITTTLVGILKKENTIGEGVVEHDKDQSIVETYSLLFKIFKLPSVWALMIILLTVKIGFAASDAVTGLKLIEEGVPRDRLAMLAVPMVPIQIILPLMISKYTTGPRPLDIFTRAMFPRLVMGLVFAYVVWWAPSTRLVSGEYPFYFYMVVLFVYSLQQVALYCMFVSQMAFYAQVSDPAIGGTYMTLLNTITNFGGNWPNTVALWLVDPLSWKGCSTGGPCNNEDEMTACTNAGGKCSTSIDGYYIETLVCFVLGSMWLLWRSKATRRLQDIPKEAWSVMNKETS